MSIVASCVMIQRMQNKKLMSSARIVDQRNYSSENNRYLFVVGYNASFVS